MRDHAHDTLAGVNKDRVVRTCCSAWRSELPELAAEPKEKVIAALLAFDSISLLLEITDQHVSDPMLLWQQLDIGCLLGPLVMRATSNHKHVASYFRSAKLLADSEETVLLARNFASTKPGWPASKEGWSDTAAGPQKGGKGKGKGKAKGKGKGKGKGSKHNDSAPAPKAHAPAEAKGGGARAAPDQGNGGGVKPNPDPGTKAKGKGKGGKPEPEPGTKAKGKGKGKKGKPDPAPGAGAKAPRKGGQ
jgi:hypothetical protein